MSDKWSLVTALNGAYSRTVWNTQEGAVADRERQLCPCRIKERGKFITIWPLGWTAIRRIRNEG